MVRASGSQDGEPGISIPLQYNDDHWRDIFKKYDRDGDGKISYMELKAMIRGDEYTHDIPLCVARTIMKRADLDNSGYLEFPEFIAMIHRKDMQGVFGHLVQRYIHSVVPGRPVPPSMSQQQRTRDLPDGLYEEEYSCSPPPVAMIIISTLEILLFLYDAIAHRAVSVEGPAATLLIYNPHKRNEIWRYVTYMFVHVGAFHLLVNLSVQVLLGLPLEMVHRWWRVLIIYLAGVLAGSLGTSVSDPSVHLAGASGGVYALITAHVATIILNWKQMEYALLQSFIFVSVAVLDVGQAIWRRYVTEVDDNVGYVAHIAGALAGLLVGINILRNLEVKTWEKVVWWLSIFTYTALMVAAILWNVLNISYYERI